MVFSDSHARETPGEGDRTEEEGTSGPGPRVGTQAFLGKVAPHVFCDRPLPAAALCLNAPDVKHYARLRIP